MDSVLRAAGGIKTVRSPWLSTFLRVLPWLALIIAVVVLLPGNLVQAGGPQIFGTGVITVVVVLFAFQILLARVPETFAALWRRKLIVGNADLLETEFHPDNQQNLNPQEQAERYIAYINDFEKLLNNRKGQWAMVISFELLVNLWLGFLNFGFWNALIHRQIGLLEVGEVVFDMALAALIAPMAWRLIIIGLQIWRLPDRFDLKIQFEHPDQCGGLQPLGNLCLWNILIISLPLVFLGGWLLIAKSDTSGFSFYSTPVWESMLSQAKGYEKVYTELLWALVPFTILGFILPLWNTHQAMVEKKQEMLARLDEHIENITDEWNAAVESIGTLTTAEGNEKLARLEFARQIYQRQKRLPVWPFNLNIFLKFASTQVIPLLSLTSLGPKVIDIVSIIVNVISPSSQ